MLCFVRHVLSTHHSPAKTSKPFRAPSLIRTLPSDSFSIKIAITGSKRGATTDLRKYTKMREQTEMRKNTEML